MAYQMRRESVDFLQTAPVILRYTTDVAAAQTAVFAELSGDPASWRHWFPGVRDGAYDSPPPHGVGSLRRVRVRGAGTYRETIVAWEEPRAWGWRVDATTLPLATALLEHWALEPAGNGTRITWTFAVDPKPWFRLGLSAVPGVMERVFRTAMRNLERRLRT